MEHTDGTPVTVSAPLPLEPEPDQRPPALQRPAPNHLTPMVTDRGFQHLPPIPHSYGGEVRVNESSAAEHPHIWLNVTCPVNLNEPSGPRREAVAHLPIEDAQRLAEQIMFLVEHRYQNEGPTQAGAEGDIYTAPCIVADTRRRVPIPDTIMGTAWRDTIAHVLGPEYDQMPIRYLFKAADAAGVILEQWRESGPRVGETTPPEGPTDA